MEIDRYVSSKPLTPYAPSWDFSIGKCVLPINLELLSKTCLEKEQQILDLPVVVIKSEDKKEIYFDGCTGLGKNSTTSRSWLYNIFDWNTPETNSLKLYVREKVEEYNHNLGNITPEILYVQCWYNVLRFGQKIKPHLHCTDENAYLSAHFTIQCDNTSTMYMNPVNQLNDPYIIERKNKPGNFTIFPEYIPHFTTKHLSDVPRITMAMDIRTIQPDGDNWIKL